MNRILVLPLLIPLATAVASLLAGSSRRLQGGIALAGTAALVVAAGVLLGAVREGAILVVQVGGWAAPFGISLVADVLGAVMVMVTALLALAVVVYMLGDEGTEEEAPLQVALFQVLLLGVNGAFLTGDLFNLYVWFEVLLIASFVLLVAGTRREQVRAAVPYVVMSLVSSMILLSAAGLLYGMTGTLNFAELALLLADTESPGLATAVAVMFLVAFGVKAALFPLFFWLPAAYPAAPVAVAAFFGGVLTKVGVYAMLRLFTLLFTHEVAYTHTLILALAGITMVTGVLGAVAQTEIRRLLSFHIVSQIGYLAMAVALFTPLALTGALFFMVHVILAKAALFLVGGIIYRMQGSFELDRLGGLYRARPWLAVLFLVPALSLAGLPPFSGFWAKLLVVRAGLEVEQYLMAGVALGVGLLTLFSMTKIWMAAFWKDAPPGQGSASSASPSAHRPRRVWGVGFTALAPVAMLALILLGMGVWAEPLLSLATLASQQLMDPALYVTAVLGGGS
jgi:multicomponent Na+:H+ antiporter subunit D